jgi:outer membrane protein OmpA-like peptidoglycan-associated protein
MTSRFRFQRWGGAAAWAAAALLAACSSTPPSQPGSSQQPAPASPGFFGGLFGPSLSPPLEAQRKHLVDALRGTPVTVEGTSDGRLRVEVPLKFAFDPGRSVVKPPLAAVLNEMATGLKPHAQAEVRIASPADSAKGSAMLAQDRAASTRDYLVSRGVPATRFSSLSRATGEAVELLITDRGAAAAAR